MLKLKSVLIFFMANSLSVPVLAMDTGVPSILSKHIEQTATSSTVMGKEPDIGRRLSEECSGSGSGEAACKGQLEDKKAPSTAGSTAPKPVAETVPAAKRGKGGAGAGLVYPGHWGHGSDDAPSHNQYGDSAHGK